jgi:hypothetical protein
MRDVILGLNDGLVSMFLLLLGISGGGAKATEVSTFCKSPDIFGDSAHVNLLPQAFF